MADKESVKAFGERLNHALKEKRITQHELAQMTGVSDSNISHYARGEYAPKRENIYKIASALNINVMWLLGFTDDPTNDESTTLNTKRELNSLLTQLTEKQLEDVIEFIKRFVISK